jgi:hypothetical protein
MRRKSPKRQAVNQLFEELVSFPELLACPNFSIEVVSIQEEELRRYRRRWRGKRRRWRIVERRLLTVLERFVFEEPSDLWQLIPRTLPDPFETSHLASVLGIPDGLLKRLPTVSANPGSLRPSERKATRLYTPASRGRLDWTIMQWPHDCDRSSDFQW